MKKIYNGIWNPGKFGGGLDAFSGGAIDVETTDSWSTRWLAHLFDSPLRRAH
ncbi:hypothetical protein ACFL2H_07345 [Planctomycetota bacterium]